jgi:hypothetical protein
MKKEWADKWVAALRSGNYVQGQASLKQLNRHTEDAVPSFCCLGVLCDLAKDSENVKAHWEGQTMVCADSKNNAILPWPVQKEVGMQSQFGDLTGIKGFHNLSLPELNDKAGKSFAEIADVIEKYWEQL